MFQITMAALALQAFEQTINDYLMESREKLEKHQLKPMHPKEYKNFKEFKVAVDKYAGVVRQEKDQMIWNCQSIIDDLNHNHGKSKIMIKKFLSGVTDILSHLEKSVNMPFLVKENPIDYNMDEFENKLMDLFTKLI